MLLCLKFATLEPFLETLLRIHLSEEILKRGYSSNLAIQLCCEREVGN